MGRSYITAVNVKSVLHGIIFLLITGEYTLERSPINVNNVTRRFLRNMVLSLTREYTLEQNLISVSNVFPVFCDYRHPPVFALLIKRVFFNITYANSAHHISCRVTVYGITACVSVVHKLYRKNILLILQGRCLSSLILSFPYIQSNLITHHHLVRYHVI